VKPLQPHGHKGFCRDPDAITPLHPRPYLLSPRFVNSHRSNLIHHQPLVVSTTTTTHNPAVAAIALTASRFWCFHHFTIPYPEQPQSSTPTTSTAATTSHTFASDRPYQHHLRASLPVTSLTFTSYRPHEHHLPASLPATSLTFTSHRPYQHDY
jgi:hypothetical protein